jgi:hypothetical protein
MRTLAGAAAVALALMFVPAAGALEARSFRYERTLTPTGPGPATLEPDGPLFAHTRLDLGDLRILDAEGRQVPYRRLPVAAGPPVRSARLLNVGRQGRAAVALVDLGPRRFVHDQIELEVADQEFVGRVTVSGSDDRRTFTRLAAGVIFDIQGPDVQARSTKVVFPPSDFRYLSLRATGVSEIVDVAVMRPDPQLRRLPRPGKVRRTSANPTRLVLDIGHRKTPVDVLYVSASTPRYDRDALIEGSNDGRRWRPLTRTRVFRITGSVPSPIGLAARHRYLRVTIFNGDDEPLEGLRLRALADSRRLLLEGGHPGPMRLLYGNPAERPPRYDFARLPTPELGLSRARAGRLGPERVNASFEPPADTRSFSARHPEVVTGALALAALALGVGGFLALRRRT